MSALGDKQTLGYAGAMSALRPKADIDHDGGDKVHRSKLFDYFVG
jgi:hypothetical protein